MWLVSVPAVGIWDVVTLAHPHKLAVARESYQSYFCSPVYTRRLTKDEEQTDDLSQCLNHPLFFRGRRVDCSCSECEQ